ncbi:molybdenum cofactor guanylyltransferase [Ornithinimicrobium sp. LYQ103]|uniref:molybdenum cofactor guanylyltransferase n=1 Tax=Ornithinimicrobium sp. LYQ103 TaxID=3378796 RepID=UPI0038524A55
MTVDLLVLAGGRGERLGGQDKAAIVVAGRTLLDRVLDAAQTLGGRTVVVGHGPVPAGVVRTLEDPPDGGPVAGIAAGLAALDDADPASSDDAAARPAAADWVAVVAVDQPGATPALVALHTALGSLPTDGVDALSHVDGTGHRQWLLALYRRAALDAALAALPEARDVSVRRLVGPLRWHEVPSGADHLGDIDTWGDLERWQRDP